MGRIRIVPLIRDDRSRIFSLSFILLPNWDAPDGTSIFDIFLMEAEKQKDIKDFEEREQFCLERYGETYSQMTARRSQQLTPAQQQKRQQQALDSGEELSSLPYHMEPDEYYDYYADYPC
jgi:hypothetical protein